MLAVSARGSHTTTRCVLSRFSGWYDTVEPMNYRITDKQVLSPSTMQLTLQPEADEGVRWRPGQYVAIDFRRFGRATPARCFSITNQPNEAGIVQIALRVSGRFTSSLANQPLHSLCNVQGAFGGFIDTPDTSKHSVLIAGGIGITPIYALATAIAEQTDRYCTVLYSVRDQNDVPFAEELQALATKHRSVRLAFVVNNGPTDRFSAQQAVAGRIDTQLLTQASNNALSTTSFFICGPQGFMDVMTEMLATAGADSTNIKTEAFSQATDSSEQKGLLRYASTYTLSTLAFLLIGGAIVRADVVKANTASSPTVTPTTTTVQTAPTTTVRTEESEDTTPVTPTTTTQQTTTVQPTTPTTTYTPRMQSYQRPVSTVS